MYCRHTVCWHLRLCYYTFDLFNFFEKGNISALQRSVSGPSTGTDLMGPEQNLSHWQKSECDRLQLQAGERHSPSCLISDGWTLPGLILFWTELLLASRFGLVLFHTPWVYLWTLSVAKWKVLDFYAILKETVPLHVITWNTQSLPMSSALVGCWKI